MAIKKPSGSRPIILCMHCGEQFTALPKEGLCSRCKTTEKRAAMDEENRKIWEGNKFKKPFRCAYCERERKIEEKRAEANK